jgi:hypothetical protein
MRTLVSGAVTIKDLKSGKVTRYKNQVQQSFIQALLQYAQTGGVIINYQYTVQLLDSNGNIVGQYQTSLSYKQVSLNLVASFTAIASNVASGASILQLYVSSSLGNFLVAQVNNVSLPSNSTIEIVWDISFTLQPNDYFSPYLIFALFSPPSSTVQFTNVPTPNVQYAIKAINNYGYLTYPPSYYVTYNGQSIQVTPTIAQNGIDIVYSITNITSSTTFTSVTIYVTAQNGNVNLVPQIQQVTAQVGQAISIYYVSTWSTS